MNWASAIDFTLAALNFCLMICSISNDSLVFIVNLLSGIFCLLMGFIAMDK